MTGLRLAGHVVPGWGLVTPGSDLCPAGTGIRVGTGGWDGVGGGFGANTAGIAVDVECSRGVDGGADHAVEEGGIVVFLKQCCNKSV
jgi:hypothetical protein|mmetsp:Transcript_24564/g.38911  ORF Transcript_24564/g.38911 Transcript_24564/m.38911 type:complete len:87 (+) Transcript_24564:1108-1368(+)